MRLILLGIVLNLLIGNVVIGGGLFSKCRCDVRTRVHTMANKWEHEKLSDALLRYRYKDQSILLMLAARGIRATDFGTADPSYSAPQVENQCQTIDLLIEKDAHIDATDESNATPLMYAAMFGRWQAVQQLVKKAEQLQIDRQAFVNAKDFRGFTPLMCAVTAHAPLPPCIETVTCLLDYGADANAVNTLKVSVLDIAIWNHCPPAVIETLKNRGAKTNYFKDEDDAFAQAAAYQRSLICAYVARLNA